MSLTKKVEVDDKFSTCLHHYSIQESYTNSNQNKILYHFLSGNVRDKTMDDKLMYVIPFYSKQK